MITNPASFDEIQKFLREILDNQLAVEIYKQLLEDGGNTAKGISENLQVKGIKASLTRVYEEISVLLRKGLIKRVTKRPPIYTTVQTKETFEPLAKQFFMETREILMRRWAASYPFLPDEIKDPKKSTSLTKMPMVNFNPYPVVDIFNITVDGLKNYYLRVFESTTILCSNAVTDTMLNADKVISIFSEDEFQSFAQRINTIYERQGKIIFKTLSHETSQLVERFTRIKEIPEQYQQFLQKIDYELREPTNLINSFVIGDSNVLFPIGIGGSSNKTFSIFEVRDPIIIKQARLAFHSAWKTAKPVIKIIDNEIITS